MKNFKALLFVLVIAPVSVFAAIVGDFNTSENGYKGTSFSVNLDANTHVIIAGQNEVPNHRFVDSEQADTFGLLNVGITDFAIRDRRNNSESDIFAKDIAEILASRGKGQPDSGVEFLGA